LDTFSHALWGRGLFGFRGHPWMALLFGAAPDLISFGAFSGYSLFNGTYVPGPPALETLPQWVFITYNLMHSFVTAALVISLLAWWRRDIAFAMLAWPFHILLDFPFHTAEYFPTHLFWPLSDFYFDGISWGTPMVWFSNLAGLMLLFAWRYYRKKKGIISS
jgi:hypothetical protein